MQHNITSTEQEICCFFKVTHSLEAEIVADNHKQVHLLFCCKLQTKQITTKSCLLCGF